MVEVKGIDEREAKAYIDYLEGKYHRRLKELSVEVDGEYVNLNYRFEPVAFERIRRITGYLSGTLDRFNNAKKAEVADRVVHSFGSLEKLDENAEKK